MLFRLFFILFLLSGFAYARDDVQAWQWLDLKVLEYKKHKINLHFENWIADDVKEEKLLLAALRYKNEFHQLLQLGVHYSYLDIRHLVTDEWSYHQRLEVEFNPRANVHGQLAFMLRNRLEYRWYEDATKDENFRSRHRPQFTYYTKHKILKKWFVNSELFIDYENNKLNEFRTIPIGVGFQLMPKLNLNAFYMIQSKRPATRRDWQHGHILGTHLIVRF
jgi:hypothetical protein